MRVDLVSNSDGTDVGNFHLPGCMLMRARAGKNTKILHHTSVQAAEKDGLSFCPFCRRRYEKLHPDSHIDSAVYTSDPPRPKPRMYFYAIRDMGMYHEDPDCRLFWLLAKGYRGDLLCDLVEFPSNDAATYDGYSPCSCVHTTDAKIFGWME